MSHAIVDDLADPGAWTPRAADGSPSTVVSVGRGPDQRLTGPTLRIAAGAGAAGHRVDRTLAAPVDLSAFDDLELWLRSDRAADGSDAQPFFLELRLGSAASPVGAAGNAWHRLLPVGPGWQCVPLALDDLAPAVRGALTQIRLTCLDGAAPFALDLDRLVAVRPELLGDADAGLVARLGGRVEIQHAPVLAVVAPAAPPPEPYLLITSYAARPAPERSPSPGYRTDYTATGFSIRPPSVPFDLLYAVDAVAGARADVATLLEFVYGELTPVSVLDVAGRPLTIEGVAAPQLALAALPTQPTVYLKLSSAQRGTAARVPAVPPFNRVDVEVDTRAVA
jgi:hypothetical protein